MSYHGVVCCVSLSFSDYRGLVWLGVGHIPDMLFGWLKIWAYIETQQVGWMLFQC
jgi:hypothetical protein